MKTVEFVDLERFMGDWYVIANIPTFIEKKATNAIESYELMDDGKTIKTTFSFFNETPEGKKKVYNPTGFVYNTKTNAEWRMQFIWPFKSANGWSRNLVPRICTEIRGALSFSMVSR